MDVAGDYTFDAPQDMVWAALLDPNVLGSVMPGGKGFEQTGEDEYAGVLEVKVGPVQGTFKGQIKLSDIVAPESYTITVDGKGAPGFVKATGALKLEARDPQTYMTYSGSAQVGGRIASVGQRLMDSAAKSIIRQSLDGLNEYLKIEAAKQAPPAPPPEPEAEAAQATAQATAAPVAHAPAAAPTSAPTEYKPPSQAALGLKVTLDVLNDILPGGYQAWLGATVLIAIILIMLFAAGHA